jgi:hypothetical protein
MGKLLDEAKKSARTLNKVFFGAILFIIVMLLCLIITTTFQLAFGNITVYSFVAINLILIWLGLLIGYLAWAIYFFNINLGLTNESWAELKEKRMTEGEMGNVDQNQGKSESGPEENIYKDQSLGLPSGTIRGTLALTLLVGGLALFIYSMGDPEIQEGNSFIYDNFEFFKTAFLMMIAFYFGSKSLEFLRKDTPGGIIQKRFGNQGSSGSEDPLRNSGSDDLTISEPIQSEQKVAQSIEPEPPAVSSELVGKTMRPPLAFQNDSVTIEHQILDNEDIEDSCKANNIETAAMQAVIKVESGGAGFLANGQPKILFEGHLFWKHLANRKANGKIPEGPEYYVADYPDIVYKNWTKQYYLGGEKEYLRLEKAILIDRDSAYLSTSWGKFQILGENFEVCGFKGKSVLDFVEAQKRSELEQLKAFISFISNTKFKGKALLEYLQVKDWSSFARAYNGPAYAQNQYDVKLEQAYQDFGTRMNTNIKALLTRKDMEEKQTLGDLEISETDNTIFTCKTLELPWLNNQRNISCIPTGTYTVIKRTSDKYGTHFQVLNVPDRSMILIHAGNYFSQTQGCILVGSDFMDVNQDNFRDVVESKKTLHKMYALMPDKFELKIC